MYVRVLEVVTILLIFAEQRICNSQQIAIGGLFNDTETQNVQKIAFKFAINQVNEAYEDRGVQFRPSCREYAAFGGSLVANEKICDLMYEGVAGIFGPQHGDSQHIVEAICDAKEIPHIQTRFNAQQTESSCMVNLYPEPRSLSQVFPLIVQEWKWKRILILYQDSESFVRTSSLMKYENDSSVVFNLKRIVQDEKLGYRKMLREIKEAEEHNIVIDCDIATVSEIFKQAQQIGLTGSDYSFLITNLDFQTLDMEPYQYGGANITGIRLFDPQSITETIEKLNEFALSQNEAHQNVTENTFPLEAALIYDAVHLFADATLAILDDENKRSIQRVLCENQTSTWQQGFSIINTIKLTIHQGLTGDVKFDYKGSRSEFSVDIIELSPDGIVKVGSWKTSSDDIVIQRTFVPTKPGVPNTLKNTTFIVDLILSDPYAKRKGSFTQLSGNDQYEGYCVDLIYELSSLNDNFSVIFIIDKDGKSGEKKGNTNPPEWNGVIGTIQRGEADLGCGDITINQEREEAVDLTLPFMDLGIAILYKKAQSQSPGFFSFLSPFDTQVWILVITAYVTVSLMFFVMARISPYEWRNPFPCVQDPDELENQFTLSNSFWFTMGALMQQGSEIAPVSVSTRMAAGVWWFFTLIMVSCYTANLAAFLTIETPSEDFTNIRELYENPAIDYGVMKGGATYKFFEKSNEPLYINMFNKMKEKKYVFMEKSIDGVKKAEDKNTKYAFLMESSSIEYYMERHCDLRQVGNPIDSKGYAIAMKKNSWYLNLFSQSILKMQEEGKLSELKRKWWKEKYVEPCATIKEENAETLGLANLGGVFIVLGAGVLVALIVAILEQIIYVWAVSKEENLSMTERLKSELKFFLRCRGTIKRIGSEDDQSDSDGNGNDHNHDLRIVY